ncbi:MAG: ATP-binding cassette domain-containing protein [Succinivibrio sp.]|nr:ATP-binding cassette domain-containing protein [Succinivibrio sp.]
MIRLEHISKTFSSVQGPVKALSDISLQIEKGEIFGIIGFSGAGKSTLVRCINLLERPDRGGKVFIDSTELSALPYSELRAARLNIGMIFQHFNLMPSRTVLDNVTFPLNYRRIPATQQVRKARHLLELVGLENFEQRYPSELSGGQKQRVAIARALASDPKILLCDEATSALDPQTTREILELLASLNASLGLTLVVITHEMAVVKDLCHKVAVLEQGRLVESGETFEVFSNPQQEITRRFVSAASNLAKVEQLKKLRPDFFALKAGELLVRLSYLKRSVSEPLISLITSRFSLQFNILYADVELVGGAPIGGTVGVLGGQSGSIAEALHFLEQKNVKVEVL